MTDFMNTLIHDGKNNEVLAFLEPLIGDYLGAKTYLRYATSFEDTEVDTGKRNNISLYKVEGPVLEEFPCLNNIFVFIVENEVAFVDILSGCSIPLFSMSQDEIEYSKDGIFTIEYERLKEEDIQSILYFL